MMIRCVTPVGAREPDICQRLEQLQGSLKGSLKGNAVRQDGNMVIIEIENEPQVRLVQSLARSLGFLPAN